MAFPTTPVLDNFNTTGTQNLTARAGWGATAIGTNTWATDATPTFAGSPSPNGGNYWNKSAADSECYCKVTQFATATDTLVVCARITATGGNPTFYGVRWAALGTTDFQLCKCVAGTFTNLGVNTATTFTAGDSFGISVIGTQITSWYKSGAGAWVQKDAVVDSSITGSGFIGGMWKTQGAGVERIDDFGGGMLVQAFGSQFPRHIGPAAVGFGK